MKSSTHRGEMSDTLAKVAALETDVAGIKGDMSSLKGDVNAFAAETRAGFQRVFERLEKSTNRTTPWNLIFSGAAVALTLALGMSAWANAYFGQNIAFAQREATRALEQFNTVQEHLESARKEHLGLAIEQARIDERVKMQAVEVDRLRSRDNPASRP